MDKRRQRPMGRSSTGLDANIAAVLAISVTWISGLVFLLLERESPFVRFHAMQSFIFFGAVTLVAVVVAAVPVLPSALTALVSVIALAAWVVLLVQALRGRWFALPVVGRIARKWALRG